MKVLIACEESGTVRDAFRAKGHYAVSCDLLPSSGDHLGIHYQMDIADLLKWEFTWDMIIAFPPCTDLAVSGARYFECKRENGSQEKSIHFFMMFANHPCPKIVIENPVGIMSTVWRKPDQIIQPWQFGHGEVKKTCLWLKGVPKLTPTNIVSGREPRIWKMPPSKDRAKLRSKTYPGIAKAMATQYGNL